jgi:hypothetical protein
MSYAHMYVILQSTWLVNLVLATVRCTTPEYVFGNASKQDRPLKHMVLMLYMQHAAHCECLPLMHACACSRT